MYTKSKLDHNALQANRDFESRGYWKKRLAGFHFRDYCYHHQVTGNSTPEAADNTCIIKGSEGLTRKLDHIALTYKAKHIVLLTAMGVMLRKYTGAGDVSVFTPLYSSELAEDEPVYMMPVRMQEAGHNFKDLLDAVKNDFIHDARYGKYSLKNILAAAETGYTTGAGIGMALREIQAPVNTMEQGLGIFFTFSIDEVLTIQVSYDTNRFDGAYISYLAGLYLSLLERLISEPDAQVAGIELLSPAAQQEILDTFTSTVVVPAGATVLTMLEEQCRLHPDNIALRFEDISWSYSELKAASDRFATMLRSDYGIVTGSLVGILMDRSIQLVVTILGILKAGGVYVPLDPEYPLNRIHTILEESGLEVLVADAIYAKGLAWNGQVIVAAETMDTTPFSGELPPVTPADLAYIIYTSGTTGKPKGVVIPHGALFNYIRWAAGYYVGTDKDNFAFYSSISFDLTVTSLFTPLVSGNTMIIYGGEDKADLLWRVFSEGVASLIKVTPSHLRLLLGMPEFGVGCTHKLKLIVGGEQLESALAQEVHNRLGGNVVIYNEYGPTETTVGCMISRFVPGSISASVPIGYPVANARIYLLDKYQQLVAAGVEGELYVSGEVVGAGYWRNETLTDSRFLPDPFASGLRMYKTGDVAVWLPETGLVYRGREDEQLKLRGYRIEPAEIEQVLLGYEGIREAVVTGNDQYLSAYYVGDQEAGNMALRTYLQARLPAYMVPAYYTRLASLPLTVNGKLDKKALPLPVQQAVHTPPEGDLENNLVQIWADVLKKDAAGISVTASFFELDMNSIAAIVLVNRISRQLNVKISLKQLFTFKHIRDVGNYISTAERVLYAPISKTLSKAHYKVSSSQQRLYFLYEANKTSLAYNITQVVKLEGRLDKERMQDAFKKLITRHENFRTAFEVVNGELVQKIRPEVPFNLAVYHGGEEDVTGIMAQFRQPFDLSNDTLLRAGVIVLNEQQHILLVDMHHITADGVSQGILVKDFMALYNGEILPELRLQYKDYAAWQQGKEEKEKAAQHKNFWLQEFEEAVKTLDLPADYPRPLIKDHRGGQLRFELDETTTGQLKQLAAAEGVTLFTLLLSLFNILLGKLGNREDVVVGTSAAGRQHPDLEKIIGMLVNMVTIRNYPQGQLTFREFLAAVNTKTLSCFEHQAYQYEQLIEELKPERGTGRNPLFDVMFDFHNFELPVLEIPGLVLQPYHTESTTSKFDLTLSAYEAGPKLCFNLEYATALFKRTTAERFIRYFRNILPVVIANPDIKLAAVDMMDKTERYQLLQEYNNTARVYPEGTVVTLFDQQADIQKDHTAIICGDTTLSYAALKDSVDRMACYLRDVCGVASGQLVGILLDRDINLVAVILGILKAGGAYVPLEPGTPSGRLHTILEESGLQVLISKPQYLEEGFTWNGRVVAPETMLAPVTEAVPQTLPSLSPSDLAYIIYTSGTTGKPKGVMVPHRALLNYTCWAAEHYLQGQAHSVALYSSIAFDLTITSIFMPLITGNKIIVYGGEDKGRLLEQIFSDGLADVIKLTPSHLRMLTVMEGFRPGAGHKKLIVGGEQLETQLTREVMKRLGGNATIYNEYGPTETTVGCMISQFNEAEDLPVVPVGFPIANTKIYLLDKYLQPVAAGAEGEIYVSGSGVGDGYWRNDGLTAERFIPDPFEPGQRLYQTGDAGVWLPEKGILFRGRLDEQIKIRGYRIEPAEVEQVLLTHHLVKAAAVIDEGTGSDKYLIAYYVSDVALEPAVLREHLQARLPEYMVPLHYIWLETLPLTVNGKLNRKMLPAPQIAVTSGHTAPAGEIEERLAEIWAEVLKLDKSQISVTKSFFELGGHSLKAIELINKIHKVLEVEMSLDDVFESDDILSMARLVRISRKKAYMSITRTEQQDRYVLSSTQKGMFFLHGLDKMSLAYNMPRIIRLEGAVDKGRILNVFKQLIDRHEVFRTSFEMTDSGPVQVIAPAVNFEIEQHHFSEEALAQITEKLIRPFDLKKAPLLRAGLVEVNAQEHYLLVDTHHIIMDGTSNGILIKEFVDLYNGRELPPLKLQYKDYTEWQQGTERQQEIMQQKAFWLTEFSGGLPVLELPVDFPRPLTKSHEGSTIDFQLSAAEVKKINALKETEECTLFMVLIAAYNVLLAKITGQDDIVIGASVSSRKHEDLQGVLGLFLDTIPIRNRPAADNSFRVFLRQVRAKVLRCLDNQSYQYESLAEELNIRRDTTHNALFDVMFAVQNYDKAAFKLPALNFTTVSRKGFESKFDLTLTATEQGDQVWMSLEYCTKLFRPETAERFIAWFRNILSAVLSNHDMLIGNIEIVTAEEQAEILHTFNTPAVTDDSGKIITDLIDDMVQQRGTAVAVSCRDKSLSYEQLDQQANQLAHYLLDTKKVQPEEVVAICYERSTEMIIALLAVLKAGASFLVAEPHFPVSRIAAMLDEAHVKCLLTNITDDRLSGLAADICRIQDAAPVINQYPVTAPAVQVHTAHTAYVIYTSGSTGHPKGIRIAHASLLDYTLTFRDYFNITAADKVIQQSSLAFDTAIEEIFPALVSGAGIIIMPDAAMDIPYMVKTIQQEKATVLSTTPLVLNELNNYTNSLASLRVIISGGDVLKPGHIVRLVNQYTLYNTYGPAESTVCVTYNKIERPADVFSIGKPIRNREVLICNAAGGLCPVGIKGEICVSGAGLAKGYINNDAAMKERFVAHPYKAGERLYKTGDMGRWLPDGRIDFLGRLDDQVKIRGYRIEPGEIENVLKEYPGVQEAVVLSYNYSENDKALVAFVVLSGETGSTQDIRAYLRGRLPNYMIPAVITPITEIPTGNTGKIDKAALLRNIPVDDVINASKRLPEGGIAKQLAEIWKALLHVPVVGLDDTFFDLGGHSLLLLKNNENIRLTFGVELPLDLFFYQTLEQVAHSIDVSMGIQKTSPVL